MSSVRKTMRSPESAAQHYSVKINSYSQEVSEGLFMPQEMFLGVCDTKTKIQLSFWTGKEAAEFGKAQ